MPFEIVRNDITKMKVDAIVTPAKESLLGSGGVDGVIRAAAGSALDEECRRLGGCKTGSAKYTMGYALPARYIIHTVGPVWQGGSMGEKELLESCYKESLRLAKELGCESIAFPLISAGAYGYPKDKAIRTAIDTIGTFLMENDMLVYLVVFDRSAFQISSKLFSAIEAFIDDSYVEQYKHSPLYRRFSAANRPRERYYGVFVPEDDVVELCVAPPAATSADELKAPSLSDMLGQIDESFSEMLLRKIDERGMSDAACYKKANIDRRLFSKIRSDKHYKPAKPTVLAFAIALELNLEDTEDMLRKAGFALSHSNKFDIIVEYFIRNGNYNVFEINEALFAFDQNLLGA